LTAEPNKQDVIQSGGVPPVPEPGRRHGQRTRRCDPVGRSDPARPRRLRAGKVHLARGLDGQVPSIPSSDGARRRGGVTGCHSPCHDGWAPSSPCLTGCSTPRRDASRRWRLTAARRKRGQQMVLDGLWASSTMGNGAIRPLAATPGPLTVLCGSDAVEHASWRGLDGVAPQKAAYSSA